MKFSFITSWGAGRRNVGAGADQREHSQRAGGKEDQEKAEHRRARWHVVAPSGHQGEPRATFRP